MKNFTALPILALLAFIAVASATEATKWQNAVKCGQRFDRINYIIDVFCRHSQEASEMRNGMYGPSEWAKQGIGMTGARGNRFVVKIEGNCQPAQYVPYDWCKAQFQQMCATTKNKWGCQTQSFGQNSCQKFIIGPRSSPQAATVPTVNGKQIV
jgi:hypothetical protein